MSKKLYLFFLKVFFLVLSTSCSWTDPQPSILVVAVDSLSFDSLRCGDSEKNKGFKIVCDEMIRFTHAYSPSILTQSSLSSLLTGKYPFEHGVWNNGATFLSAKHKTSAEVALQKKYKTIFISGGVPIWRKAGIDQGFETFEDSITIDYMRYYRDVLTNINILIDWIDEDLEDSPFFSFLFLNDLQFSDFPTVDNDGYPREKTFDGQLREIDESLASLFTHLKKRKLWDTTWVFIVGTNGLHKDLRENESIGTNLYHENTNVALFIKPPSKEEHPRAARTMDMNVNLVDVGRLFFEILDTEFYETSKTYFKTISLKNLIYENVKEQSQRILLFESGWPQWRGIGQTKFALQKENYLLVYNQPPLLFNTLVDRNQIYPVDYAQSTNSFLTENATQLLAFLNSTNKYEIKSEAVKKYRLASLFFKKESWNSDYLRDAQAFFEKNKDREVAGWLAAYYIENSLWTDLLKLANEVGDTDWSWLASVNIKQVYKEPNICIQMILNFQKISSENSFALRCDDENMQALFSYLKYRDRAEKKENLIKIYRAYKTEEQIQRLNYQNGYTWDTNLNLVSKPSNLKVVLEAPQFSKLKKMLDLSL